jgi:hypothetical protein
MMIAIVILGLGLIMVATMFPIAWSRARVLTEYTSQVAVTETAQMTIELLTRVDGLETPAPPAPGEMGSFAGDLIFDVSNETVVAYPDTRVHALHLENMLVAAAPREFVPDRLEPWEEDYSPWLLERVAPGIPTGIYCPDNPSLCAALFFGAHVRCESRVYPPMLTQQNVDADGTFPDPLSAEDGQWFDVLDGRRYAWAVFHRLRKATWPDVPSGDDIADATKVADSIREFDVYYVTLKRSQPTVRYARQDPDLANTPDFEHPNRAVAVAPEALGPENDVLLPSPWRVQVLFPETLASNDPSLNDPPFNIPPATGIPTEIRVNSEEGETADFVVNMFQVGTQCIDELNGQVYRVAQHRIVGSEQDEAVLTLDREILLEDIDDGYISDDVTQQPHNFRDGDLADEELLRTVWVFPPPVQGVREADDPPVFVGKQPVVAIDIRSLTRSPTR